MSAIERLLNEIAVKVTREEGLDPDRVDKAIRDLLDEGLLEEGD